MFVCKLLLRGRELGQQVRPNSLVGIYWRAHMGDWCVITWRDCTWWMGVFVSTPPPTLRQGRAYVAAIHPTWATWRGLRSVGGGRVHLAWHLVAGGIVGPPLPLIGACRHGPFAHVAWLGEAWQFQNLISNTLTVLKLPFKTRITSSDLYLLTQLAMSISHWCSNLKFIQYFFVKLLYGTHGLN